MLNDFVEKVRGFVFNPVETFRKSKEDPLGSAFIYFIVLVLINAILSTLVLLAGINAMNLPDTIPGLKAIFPGILFVGLIVGGIVGIFIGGGWLHIFIWLLGGRKGYFQTVKTLMYGTTPGLLIGWIPLIGIIGLIWDLILVVIGIRELQEMSTERAVVAVILAAVIILVIIIVSVAFFLLPVSRTVTTSSFPPY
jgi:hypothetical protein